MRFFPLIIVMLFCAEAFAQTSITPASHEVGAGVVSYQIEIASTVAWTATVDANWVTLSCSTGPIAGYRILVTAAANSTGADRTATIHVNGETHTLTQRTASAAIPELWATGCSLLNGTTTIQQNSPVQVLTGEVQAIAGGGPGGMIVKTDGSLWVMGWNGYGQLGDGNPGWTNYRDVPVQVLSSGVQAVATDGLHSLFVKTDGSLWGMGANAYGELGVWTGPDLTKYPVQILSEGVKAAAAGYEFSLILKTDGSLWGMGHNELGELGDGTCTERDIPVLVLSGGVEAIAAGSAHSLILKTDGSLWATGDNGYGQLGDGTTTRRSSPVQILAGGVQSIAAGDYHSLIVKTDGSLWGMGSNSSGELGDGTTMQRNSPVQILPSGVRAIAAGDDYSLVLKTDGSLWAVGWNTHGQLGDGTERSRIVPEQIAANVEKISAGSFILARGDVGLTYPPAADSFADRVEIAGAAAIVRGSNAGATKEPGEPNHAGNAGGKSVWWKWTAPSDGTVTITTDRSNFDTVLAVYTGSAVASLTGVASNNDEGVEYLDPPYSTSQVKFTTVAGATYNIAVDGYAGASGNVMLAVSLVPTPPNDSFANRIAIADYIATVSGSNVGATKEVGEPDHSGRTGGSSVWWKWTAPYNGTVTITTNGSTFDTVLGVYTGTDVSRLSTIAYDDNDGNNLASWLQFTAVAGTEYQIVVDGYGGASGDITLAVSMAARIVPTIADEALDQTVTIGRNAIFTIGAAGFPAPTYQWQRLPNGSATWSNLADGGYYSGTTTMTLTVSGATGAMDGDQFRCVASNDAGSATSSAARLAMNTATRSGLTLMAMGADGSGQLGDGKDTNRSMPVQIANNVVNVAVGNSHAMYLTADGTLWAMGDNSDGQLGDGTFASRSTPVPIASEVANVSAGASYTMFVRTDGTLWAMGRDPNGALGLGADGEDAGVCVPAHVANRVMTVSAGHAHTLYVKVDGTLWATGYNRYGELGDGTTNSRDTPAQVASGVVSVAAGLFHTLFIKADASLWGMGDNYYGELGDLTYTNRSTPVTVATGVASVAANGEYGHTLFLKADGTLWGTGCSYDGQLGDGSSYYGRNTPVEVSTDVVSVGTGATHTVFVKADGTMWTMGNNRQGELGLGTVDSDLHATPVAVRSDVITAFSGGYSTLFLTSVPLPVVIRQPPSQSVDAGHAATLTVAASGATPFSYQWYQGASGTTSAPIVGATSATYATPQLYVTASYWVRVTNAVGSVDSLTALVSVVPSIADAINQTGLAFSSSGTRPWQVESAVTHDGLSAIQSGTITDSQQSTVQTTINGPGTISFWWKVSSESGYDYLSFYIDDQKQIGISGNIDWQQKTYAVTAGSHTLRWSYAKDASLGGGSDCGWLDELAVSVAPGFTTQPGSQTVTAGGNASFAVVASGLPAPTYHWAVSTDGGTTWNNLTDAAPNSGTATGNLTISGATAAMNGWQYRCVASNGVGPDATSNGATLTVTGLSDDAFLQRLFQAILGRPIDFGALTAYAGALAGGESRGDVLGNLLTSSEYAARQIEPVIRLYHAAFARTPDYLGLQNWCNALQTGALTLTGAADQFAGSAEFLLKYGALDNTGYVQQLYRNVLGREADPTGLADWVERLNGGATRGAILVGFSESPEFQTNLASQVEIIRLYDLLLQRVPTDLELQNWLGFLKGYDQTDTLLAQNHPSGMANSDYVSLVFQGFLRRPADAGALSTFGSALSAGTVTRGSLVDALLASTEFKMFVAPVSRLYMAAFHRVPDAGGLDNWVAYVRAGNPLQSAADEFVASPEFQLTYGSLNDTQFVTLLYENVLGREPDPTGLATWTGDLSSGWTRGQVLIGFSESQEGIALFAPTVRTSLHYFTFLNATPAQSDLDYWRNYLATLDDQMRDDLLADPAFANGG